MVTLDIYVVQGCANCRHARHLAALAAQTFPDLKVRVRELSQQVEVPEVVFATPTYLLNGKVISLGNPDEHELFDQLATAVGAERV